MKNYFYFVILLFIFIKQLGAVPPALLSSTLSIKEFSDITNTYSLTSTIIELNFDQDIYINNVKISNYNASNTAKTTSKMCLPNSCFDVPTSIYNQLGSANLICNSQSFSTSLGNNSGLTVPNGLIPLPNVARDIFIGFSNAINWVQLDMLSNDPRKVSFMFFNDFLYGSDRMNIVSRPTPSDFTSGNCNIVLGPVGGAITKSFTNQAGEVVSVNNNEFTLKPELSLIVSEVTIIANYLQKVINSIQQPTSLADMNFKTFQAALIINSDTYVSGIELIDDYIDSKSSPQAFSTDLCGLSFNDINYSSDPCCNSTLLWSECCAKRTISLDSLSIVRSGSFSSNLKNCKNPSKSNETILNLISTVASSLDPVNGCTAKYYDSVKKTFLSDLLSFIDECDDLIFGVHKFPPQCTTNSQCFSGRCDLILGTCNIPVNQNDINDLVLKCHVSKISPFIKAFLQDTWKSATSPSDFFSLYKQKVMVQNCVGLDSSRFTTISTSSGNQYVIANQTECLADKYCQYQSQITDQQDCIPGDYCVNGIDNVDSVTYPSYCYIALDEIDCVGPNYQWDPSVLYYNCKILGVQDNTTCLPTSVCPNYNSEPYVSYHQQRCATPFCYFNNEQGICATPFTFQRSFKNDAGLCVSYSYTKGQCISSSYTWWPGQGWIDEVRNTKSQCTLQPLCRTGSYIWLDRIDNFCSSFKFCDQPGPLCYTSAPKCSSTTNKTYCLATGGVYDLTNQKCVYSFQGDIYNQYQSCTSALINGTFLSCSTLTDTECQACASGSGGCPSDQSTLGCKLGWKTDPYTESLCSIYSGSCSDVEWYSKGLIEANGCNMNDIILDSKCSGVCLNSFEITSNGEAQCSDGLEYSPTGCVDYSINSQTACTNQGLVWQALSRSKQQCDNYHLCNEGNNVISNKSQSECIKCGGSYSSPFSWKSGRWVNGSNSLNNTWLPSAQWSSINSWGNSIDLTFIRNSIENAILTKLGPSTQSELLCNHMPYIYALKIIPCDCGGDPNTPSDCYRGNGTTRFVIGVAKVCFGWEDQLISGPMELYIPQESIPRIIGCIGIEVSIQPASQFFRTQILSTDVLSNSINSYDPSDIVVNDKRVIVGQIIGDGIEISMSFNSSGQIIPYQGLLNAPMELCIEPRGDISQHYPVQDFATSDGNTWTPMESNITLKNGKYCAFITQSNTYFPILRIDDWKGALLEPIFTKVQFAFIYIIAVLFSIAAISAILSIGFNSQNNLFVITLPKLLNIEITIFCLVRSLYLYLIGKEKIGPSMNNLAAFYLLSELPLYIFLSIFSTLVFFWAELSKNSTSRNRSFLSNLRIPFIVANSAMYIMFIIVLSIFHSLNSNQQHNLRIVYSTILSVLCVVLIIGYWLFGGKLIIIQFHVLRIKSKNLNRNLKNMTFVLLITSVALTLQIIFLFLNAFSKKVTIALALVYYVLVELIPCALLVYVFFSFFKKSKKKNFSTKSSEMGEVQTSSTQESFE